MQAGTKELPVPAYPYSCHAVHVLAVQDTDLALVASEIAAVKGYIYTQTQIQMQSDQHLINYFYNWVILRGKLTKQKQTKAYNHHNFGIRIIGNLRFVVWYQVSMVVPIVCEIIG